MLTIISHPDCEKHEAAPGHVEQPDRVRVIQTALEKTTFSCPVQFEQAKVANQADLLRVHQEDYVGWLMANAPKAGMVVIDEDTQMNAHTLHAALLAAGAVIQAVDLVMKQQSQAVFCNVRPPGHHAEKDKAMGFCFFNNVAVGAAYALERYSLSRVAIIDFDVHHGNGTQNIFQDDARVLLCSSFQHPFYPGYDAEQDNEHIVGVPLSSGVEGEGFKQAMAKVLQLVDDFKPELIFISAGFDAHHLDDIAEIGLQPEDYEWITKAIQALAAKHCQGRLISVLEGGYNLEALADTVPRHTQCLL